MVSKPNLAELHAQSTYTGFHTQMGEDTFRMGSMYKSVVPMIRKHIIAKADDNDVWQIWQNKRAIKIEHLDSYKITPEIVF